MSLTGLDFVWRLVTHSSSEPIAKQAIEYLLNMSFLYVGPKLKEQSAKLHKKFIGQCYRRLEDILSCPEDGSARQDCAVEEGHEVEVSEVCAIDCPNPGLIVTRLLFHRSD